MSEFGTMHALVLTGALLAAPVGPCGQAAERPARPEPEAVIRRYSEFLLGLQSFRVKISYDTRVEIDGVSRETRSVSSLAVRRPDKVAQILISGEAGSTVVSDGAKAFIYMPALRGFTEQKAPGELAKLSGHLNFSMGGILPVTGAMITPDPGKMLLTGVVKAAYLGTETVATDPCHHVRFELTEFSWDAWISAGQQPLLRKLVPDFTRLFEKAAKTSREGKPARMKYEMTYLLEQWEVNPETADGEFIFTPPDGVRKVASFFPAGSGAGSAPDR